jgi:hypothetical protein
MKTLQDGGEKTKINRKPRWRRRPSLKSIVRHDYRIYDPILFKL